MVTALRLDIEYDGAEFAGWAEQPAARTIEGVLRDALDVVFQVRPELRVAGRTDAGVHASGQVVSLTVPGAAGDLDTRRIRQSLVGLLPKDVCVRRVTVMPHDFDARADAVSRVYDYRMLMGMPSPLRRRRTLLHWGPPLDRDILHACADLTVGQHDFRAFTPTDTQHVFFARTMLECAWREDEDELILRVEADAFLRQMVRVLVGTMLECARGRREVGSFAALLGGAPRSAAGPTAPPNGLTLIAVRY